MLSPFSQHKKGLCDYEYKEAPGPQLAFDIFTDCGAFLTFSIKGAYRAYVYQEFIALKEEMAYCFLCQEKISWRSQNTHKHRIHKNEYKN